MSDNTTFTTQGGIEVSRVQQNVAEISTEIESIVNGLDTNRGVLLSSTYEFPGRYTRWDIGFLNPSLEFVGRERGFQVNALNKRGRVLLSAVEAALKADTAVQEVVVDGEQGSISGKVRECTERFAEEERSKQPSLFSVVRCLRALFFSTADSHLGLYGAFGYDLTFQFEAVKFNLSRPADQRDVVLYLPDDMIIVDHHGGKAMRVLYEFAVNGASTAGLAREGEAQPFAAAGRVDRECDHQPGEYADVVRKAKQAFKRGDLFEAVASQVGLGGGEGRGREFRTNK